MYRIIAYWLPFAYNLPNYYPTFCFYLIQVAPQYSPFLYFLGVKLTCY